MDAESIWGSAKSSRIHRWGHLTLLEEYRVEDIRKNPTTGESFVADSHGPVMWKLQCDCGYIFDIKKDDFPGRRIARNCNRPECPYTKRLQDSPRLAVGRPMTKNGRSFSLYLDNDLGEHVRDYAQKMGLSSFSKAVDRLLWIALKHEIPEID